MKGSYSQMFPVLGRRDCDVNKENKSVNRRPSAKSGKNVIQQYADSAKPLTPYSRQLGHSPIQSYRQTVQNTLVFEQGSCEPSQCAEIQQNVRSSHHLIIEQSLKEVDVVKKEMCTIKSQVQAKDLEMSKLREMYESQIQIISASINGKIEVDIKEKSSLIREINNNSAEIQSLKDAHSLLQAENQNLKIYLGERELTVKQLEAELEVCARKRRGMQEDLASMNELKDTLGTVDCQLEELITENKIKLKQLEQGRLIIRNLNTEVAALNGKIAELNREIKICHQRESQTVCQLEEEIQKYKENAIRLSKQLLRIPDLEMKLKETLSSSEEYQERISKLRETNDKLSMQLMSGCSTEKKISDLEWQLGQLRKTLIDTEGELSKVRGEFKEERKEEAVVKLSAEVKELVHQIQAQSKEIEELRKSLRDGQHEKQGKDRQIERLREEIAKLKQRASSMDELYRENLKLTSRLKEKVATIEKYELAIGDYEHQLKILSNEYTQRSLESERALHHTRELEGRCKSLQKTLGIIKEEKSSAMERCQDKEIELGMNHQMLARAESEVNQLKKSRERGQKKRLEETKQYESRINNLLMQKVQAQNNLQQQTERYIVAKRRQEAGDEKVVQLMQQVRYKQDIIRAQTSATAKLSSQVQAAREQLHLQFLEIQRAARWKQTYLTYMQEYSSLQQEMLRSASALHQPNQ